MAARPDTPLPPDAERAPTRGVTPEEAERADTHPQSTGLAPSYRPPLGKAGAGGSKTRDLPAAGDHLGDFELLRELGRGSFGKVFLARQVSLDRLVALKVSADNGGEARTLARLEHPNIVQVFSESIDPVRDLRLLCIQYVAGATLERVVRELARLAPESRDGRAILRILDRADDCPVALDAAALREREFLAGCDRVEAACWLGARLAEALAHAHAVGVRHRDVKPANVLLGCCGRPYLADFNVAAVSRGGSEGRPRGGTLAYMAPEHLEAFASGAPARTLDERADLYSLGMVLFELLTGRLPPSGADEPLAGREQVLALARQRRAAPPSFPADAEVPARLAGVVNRCLEPNPDDRYPTAAGLARALEGCREARRVEKLLPPAGPVTRALAAHPFALGVLLVLLPHFVGSAVNIAYNDVQIVGRLTPPQQATFGAAVLAYNTAIYPICLLVLARLLLPVRRVWRQLARGSCPRREAVDAARGRVLRLPAYCVGLSLLGWLPGGLLFPLLLDLRDGPVAAEVYRHFLASFLLSGLIALTYSYLATQYWVLCVLYPGLGSEARDVGRAAADELRGTAARLGRMHLLSAMIPLLGALLLVGAGGDDPSRVPGFQTLVACLIVLGMAGLGVAAAVNRRLTQTLVALTDAPPLRT